MNTPRQQSGVMLLEVLIGMLLFLIGIMGIMGLQAMSMKNTTDAKYRTEASYLANQIIGQMWANASNVSSYAVAANAVCPGTPTSDIDRWICNVKTTLPNATGANAPTIAITGTTTVTVIIRWQKDSTDPVHNLTVVTDISPS
jgi:type IV pilus assembly protein PilV